jgi:hypothetical protein
MAKKNKKKENISIEKVTIEFTLKLDNDKDIVKYFNTLDADIKRAILKGTVYTSLLNSEALVIVNEGNSWAELNLSPLAEEL